MRLTTIIALCMISIAVFAAKAPKGKLLSYSHIKLILKLFSKQNST